MSDIDDLMTKAQAQLAEHVVWLAAEIKKIPSEIGMEGAKTLLVHQASQIKLRVVRVDHGKASVVWDYPDELGLYLRSEAAPKHLRDTLVGGFIVDTDRPASTLRREP